MSRNKILLPFLLIIITILFINCDDSGNGYVDESGFEISGVVLDSMSQEPIANVIVGFTNYPDSIFLEDDSINTIYIYMSTATNDLGKFRISDIGSINNQDFHKMFAWKKENKLWLYADEPVPINEIGESRYKMTLFLTKRQN